MSAGTLSTWIAAVFALGAAVAGWRGQGEVARRALAMSALFALVALGLLGAALWSGDLSVAFVARHTIAADAPSARLNAWFADASGATLGCAAALATAALGWAWRWPRAAVAAPAAGIVVVLLTASLAGRPLAVLPFLPADGAATRVFHAEAIAVLHGVLLLGATTLAGLALARALQEWAAGNTELDPGVASLSAWAMVAMGALALTWREGALAAGTSREMDLLVARGGVWSAALAAHALAGHVTARDGAFPQLRLEATLGAMLATLAVVLASGIDGPPLLATRVLLALGVLLSTGASLRLRDEGNLGRVGAAGRGMLAVGVLLLLLVPDVPSRHLVTLGVCAAGAAALLPSWTRLPRGSGDRWRLVAATAALLALVVGRAGGAREERLGAGATLQVARGTIAHQGVSTYEQDHVTIVALALERQPGGHLDRAAQREYADARGAVLRPVQQVPATFRGVLVETRVWLDRVEADDRVVLRVAALPGAWLWWGSAACLLVACLAGAPPNARWSPGGAGPGGGEGTSP